MAALARFEELRLKLVDWKLEQYGPPLFDAGFDDLSYLQQLDRARLEEVAADAGMKKGHACLLYTSPSPRDQRGSRMPSSA